MEERYSLFMEANTVRASHCIFPLVCILDRRQSCRMAFWIRKSSSKYDLRHESWHPILDYCNTIALYYRTSRGNFLARICTKKPLKTDESEHRVSHYPIFLHTHSHLVIEFHAHHGRISCWLLLGTYLPSATSMVDSSYHFTCCLGHLCICIIAILT